MPRFLYRLAAVFVATLLSTGPALAQQPRGELMIEHTFNVDAGDQLMVDVGDADLTVRTTEGKRARVEVYLDGRDMEAARSYFREQRFRVEQSGPTVRVLTDPEESRWSFSRSRQPRIVVLTVIPRRFDVDLRTSDGHITLEALEGRAAVRSSDGDLRLTSIDGPAIDLRTSDSDIRAGLLRAPDVSVRSSDGDLNIESIESASARLRTSDGEVQVETISGGADASMAIRTSDGDVRLGTARTGTLTVDTSDGSIRAASIIARRTDVSTSDGDLDLGDVEGDLSARADGDIRARLLKPAEVAARSDDGDVALWLPVSTAAELDLRAEDVRIASAFAFTGSLEEDRARGRLGAGGPSIRLTATDGRVRVEAR